VECQDVSQFEEAPFQYDDVNCFKACLLVEGMVCAGSPEGTLDEGCGQWQQGPVQTVCSGGANVIANGGGQEVFVKEGLTKCAGGGL
jgi:hypothetical protein